MPRGKLLEKVLSSVGKDGISGLKSVIEVGKDGVLGLKSVIGERKDGVSGLRSVIGKRKSGRYSNRLSRTELINAESKLGRTLFGPIPAGHQREFFESEKNVWIWHEGYLDPVGAWYEMTVRYEVRPTGVFKRVDQGSYEKLSGKELENFRAAARTYLELVKTKLYC